MIKSKKAVLVLVAFNAHAYALPAILSGLIPFSTAGAGSISVANVQASGAEIPNLPALPHIGVAKRDAAAEPEPAAQLLGSLPLPTSNLPALPLPTAVLPSLPILGSLPLPTSGLVPSVPAVGSLPLPTSGLVPSLPALGSLPLPSAGLPSVPAVGSLPLPTSGLPAAGVPSALPSLPSVPGIPTLQFPPIDPLSSISIGIISILLSLLTKDPAALFGPVAPIHSLVKRDVPDLEEELYNVPDMEDELSKRQLPSLPVSGLSGGLPLPSVPGVSPTLALLVGGIANNLALPNGLGPVITSISGILGSAVPNFLFQLPVVQDASPAFAVLNLLPVLNPAKFQGLTGLNSFVALQSAAQSITPADVNVVRALPGSPDPTNLVTTIMTLTSNLFSLPGVVVNLKAAASLLILHSLGLVVPGIPL